MNITEQIAEFLHQGKTVVIPGIGSFSSKQVTAHYDASTQTFYPTQQRIVFDRNYSGNSIMVQYIAEKECVGINTADQMWRNYVDALQQKLVKDGSHEFPDLGTLSKDATGYSFVATEKLNTGDPTMRPVEGITQYTPNPETRNPFAVFDTPFVTESDSTPIAELKTANDESKNTAEPPHEQTQKDADITTEPTQETVVETTLEVAEIKLEETPTETIEVVETAIDILDEEQQEISSTTHEKEATPIVEPASQSIAEPQIPPQLDDLKTLQKMQEEAGSIPKKPKKKKKKAWPIIIIILMLLLGGGSYCYFFQPDMINSLLNKKSKPAPTASIVAPADIEQTVSDSESTDSLNTTKETAATESADASKVTNNTNTTTAKVSESERATITISTKVPKYNAELDPLFKNASSLTFNTDLINYQTDDIAVYQNMVMQLLNGYIENYAKSQHYSKAAEALKARANEYAGQRLADLLTPASFSVHRFLPYEDYISKYCYNVLKTRKAHQQKTVVQSELMDNTVLSRLLQEVVIANNITADAIKATPKASNRPYRSTASYSSHSKLGYDVIAGFFVNKNYADRMASGLKNKGCDAYVIEILQGYYVSMGSAESRTKVEALYSHLKEWYRGDMSIKKF